MANKLSAEYPSITATKTLLKENDEISVDQVKGYDRRVRGSPFIMEHVKIIENLTQENEKLKEELNDYENGLGKYDFDPLLSQATLCKIVEDYTDNASVVCSCGYKCDVEKLKEENEKLKETNGKRFDKIKKVEKELEDENGMSKLVHHQNMGLLEDLKKLKERLSIMKATASVHIDDINQTHQDYGNMVRKLKEEIEELKDISGYEMCPECNVWFKTDEGCESAIHDD
jgi:cell division protein FtsB